MVKYRKLKSRTVNIFFILLLVCAIAYILYLLYEKNDVLSRYRTLDKDGYIVLENKQKQEVLNYLPDGYVYIDYKYEIHGCSLSTFHRDVTSSQYVFNTKYPVYTYIIYHNDGPLLSLSPNSHKSVPFLWAQSYVVSGKPNTGILFNCDVIHSGAINTFGEKRYVEQYKICHKDDLHKLKHLDKIFKKTFNKCDTNYTYVYFLRKLTLMFPFVINHLFTDLLQTKPSDDSFIGKLINNFFIGDFYNK